MILYQKIDNACVDELEKYYCKLLNSKFSFFVLNNKNKNSILTKERSYFEVDNLDKFIYSAQNDTYFKSNIIIDKIQNYLLESDIALYKYYIEKYRYELEKKYAKKYMFGTVAVRTKNNSFITTVRGKQDLNSFTIVKNVNFKTREISVLNKKSTLNAPLLANIFNNKKVKCIVHLHIFDYKLPFYDYAFPGTLRDSNRNNKNSFNITNHGVFYLFDKNGKLL